MQSYTIGLMETPNCAAIISRTTAAFDEMLETDTAHYGESRDEGRRILFAPPLVVTFLVIEAKPIALILNVRKFK